MEELRTLWIGDVENWHDENHLLSLFAHMTCEIAQVKVIRDKATGLPAGYGFVEFLTPAIAKRVLDTHNGRPLPNNTGKVYRLNWASYGINERRPENTGPEYSIFVGDLSPEVNDYLLQQTFASQYVSAKSAKVVTDPSTGQSRGYGFVRFANEQDMMRAMVEMQGQYCGSRPMRINSATPKKMADSLTSPTSPSNLNNMYDQNDPNCTTVFIGGLDSNVNEDDLRRVFEPFGQLVYVKIPVGKGCGFVQFTTRASADNAFSLHGTYIGSQRVRLSWGRSANSTVAAAPMMKSTTPNYFPSTLGGYYSNAFGANDHYSQSFSFSPSVAPTQTTSYPMMDTAAYYAAAAAAAAAGNTSPSSLYGVSESLSVPSMEDFTSPLDIQEENNTFVKRFEDSDAMWKVGTPDDTEVLLALATSLHLDNNDDEDELPHPPAYSRFFSQTGSMLSSH